MSDNTTTPATVSHRLVGWGTFEDLTESILARMFGIMVELALPVVKEYHSDLFHDATWLRQNVKGETTFEFVVRTSGTNIGTSAQYAATSPGAVHYRLTLRAETRGPSSNADWHLDVTELSAMCGRHGGVWGDDETCEDCTDEDGNVRVR